MAAAVSAGRNRQMKNVKIFEDSELEALLTEGSCQTQEILAEIMGNARTCFYVDGQIEYSRCQGYILHLVGLARCGVL